MYAESEKPGRLLNKQHKKTEREEFKAFYAKSAEVVDYIEALLRDASEILPDNLYSAAAHRRDVATLKRRFNHEGLQFATTTLPLLATGLFEYLETGCGRYPSFRLQKDTGHPIFLSGLFRLAYNELSAHRDTAITLLYQISVSFKKFKGPYPESVLLKQLQDFVRVDASLGDIDLFNDANYPIVERARYWIRTLFKSFDLSEAIPRPGPGATNEPVAKHLRYRPHVLYTQIDDVMPYVDFFNVNSVDVIHQTKHYRDLEINKMRFPRSRFKYVFKTFGKPRGICIEENEMQFMQQAIKHAMYSWIERHPLTKGYVNFSSQEVNAQLALTSSANLLYATLDESEASDRIARELVAWVFQDTVLLEPLMALSTKWIDLPEIGDLPRAIYTQKYAPMGSGLCFPVMSIVHWALCKSILESSLQCDAAKEVYVYGDDLIVPTKGAPAIFDWLPRFGMKLNKSKSFYRSHFRESCGVHAYKGKDITPVYFKNIPQKSIDTAMSCIAIEQQLFEKGYTHVACLLRNRVRNLHGSLPMVNENSPIFGFKRKGYGLPSNWEQLRVKTDQYGNILYRVRLVKSVQTKDRPPTDEECYLRKLVTSSNSVFIGGEPSDQYVKWRYVSYPQLCGIQQPNWVTDLTKLEGDQNESENRHDGKSVIPICVWHPSASQSPRSYLAHRVTTRRRSRDRSKVHGYLISRSCILGRHGCDAVAQLRTRHNTSAGAPKGACTGSCYGPCISDMGRTSAFRIIPRVNVAFNHRSRRRLIVPIVPDWSPLVSN